MKIQSSNVILIVFIFCVLLILTICFRHKHQITDAAKVEDKQPIISEEFDDITTSTEDTDFIETTETIDETTMVITTKIPKETTVKEEKNMISLGEFRLTAYCACEKCCDEWAHIRPNGVVVGAIMEPLKAGYSIAVDPEYIPYNSKVMINGNIYEAQDCGGGIKGCRIDIYMDTHEEALDFGVQYAEVFLIVE